MLGARAYDFQAARWSRQPLGHSAAAAGGAPRSARARATLIAAHAAKIDYASLWEVGPPPLLLLVTATRSTIAASTRGASSGAQLRAPRHRPLPASHSQLRD